MMGTLQRLALVLLLGSLSWAAAAANYTDWWWNPDQSGHGLNIGQQGDTLFISWFTYDEAGRGMWLTTAGTLAGNVVQGDFVRTTGPNLGDAFDPSKVARTVVGTAKVTFSSLHAATFDWTVNGKSGSIPLVRQSWQQSDPTGSYVGGVGTPPVAAGCPFAGSPRDANRANFTVSVANNVLSVVWITEANNRIEFSAPITPSGQWMQLAGTYSSTNALGTGTFTGSLFVMDTSVVFQQVLHPDQHPACPGLPGTLTGVRAG